MIRLFKRRPPIAAAPPEAKDQALEAATQLVAGLYSPATVEAVIDAVHAAGFSEAAYFASNPDIAAAFPNPHRALLHFLAMVQNERRRFPITLDLAGLHAIRALPCDDPSILTALIASLADAAADTGPLPNLPHLSAFWPTMPALRALGARPYLLVGDSHSTFYRRSTVQGGDFLLPLHVCCSGGSAIGLGNPRSRSGHGARLRALMAFLATAALGEELPLLIQFGQVDLEFVHPFRRIKRGTPAFDPDEFHDFSQASISAYIGFLQELIPPAARSRVVVLGVFPPALKDEPLRAGYIDEHVADLEEMNDVAALQAALARLEWPGLAARTRLHAGHNALLEAAAGRAGFKFTANFQEFLSPAGVIDERFICFGKGNNHHIDFTPSKTILSNTIWRLLDPDRPVTRISFEDLSEYPDPALLPALDHPDVNPAGLSPDQASWVRDGVVIKRGFLPDALLDPYIARRAAFRPGTAWNAVGWPQGHCYEGVPELRAVALHPPLMALLEALIGEKMLFHLALTGWISTERDWHQDDVLNPPFINTWYAAVWIALDTITPQSGPFEYVPGSHRWPLLRGEKVRNFLTAEELGRKMPTTKNVEWPKYAERFLSPAIEEKITASGLPTLPFLAEKGDVLIWHSRLMHRGGKRVEAWITEGDKVRPRHPRRALITHYSGQNHRPDMVARSVTGSGHSYATFGAPLVLE